MKSLLLPILLTLVFSSSCSSGPQKEPEKAVNSPYHTLEYRGSEEQTVPRTEPVNIVIEKDLAYDKYTLDDTYPYKDTVREFQWKKIEELLHKIETAQQHPSQWGILQNRQNRNGLAPLARNVKRNAYNNMEDPFGVERYQSVPLYLVDDLSMPERYGNDGSLVRILEEPDSSDFVKVEAIYIGGEWMVPKKYVKAIADTIDRFHKIVFVDRTNQNITSLEKVDSKWLVRSMNPATTGRRRPPSQWETPTGIFVVQEKKPRMIYLKTGSSEVGGFAPHASRFCNGAYIHGVPVGSPRTSIIEYSPSLGTTPRSQMCVRNASSHAKFIYDWAPLEQALVLVIE